MLRTLRIENLVLIREAELPFGPGLNVVTGETGAGKTILAQAIGLLLGAKGDAAYIGPAAKEAYVEAELDLPDGFLEDGAAASIGELRPDDEPGLVAARRVFADGRSRAYAWGRAAAREDVAALVERLVAMSGQFEQRRLARPGHQLETLDAYAGEHQLAVRGDAALAWRELQAARRMRDELAASAAGVAAHAAELEALVEAAGDLDPGDEELLRSERERLRNAAGLAAAASAAAEALAPEVGDVDGAADLAARAGQSLDPVTAVAPELATAAAQLAEASTRLRDTASELRAFLASLEAEPGRLEHVEERLGDIADLKRRFGAGVGRRPPGAGCRRAARARRRSRRDAIPWPRQRRPSRQPRRATTPSPASYQPPGRSRRHRSPKRLGLSSQPSGSATAISASSWRAQRAGVDRMRRGRVPDPAEPRPALRAGRRDRIRR